MVFMPMPSSAAICLLALPSAISWNTSISREVRRPLRGFGPSGSIQRFSLTFGKKLRNERAEKGIPLVDFPNPLGQNAGGGLFEQKSHGTGLRCVFDIRVIIVRRENEYSGVGDGFENLTGGFQTIEQRHRDVHQHHGGAKFFDHGDRLAAVFRFADHFEVVFQLQQSCETLTHDRVVFGQQNSDSFHKLSV
jgi:hypothetical protein